MPRLNPILTSSRARLQAGLVALALLAGVVPAAAQTEDIADAKERREQTRAEAADAANDLDPLLARDAELEAAVQALQLHVETQQAKLDSIQQSLAVSRSEAQTAADRVFNMELEIGGLRGRLLATAIEAYVTPTDRRVDTLFSSDDITTAAHKRALLDTIATTEVDLIDRLRAAEDGLADLSQEAADAVARVEDEEAAEASQLEVLNEALKSEQALKDALGVRIADFRSEIDGLEADEARLTQLITSLIADEEARIAAEIEAKRRAEEQRRLAAEAAAAAEAAKQAPPPAVPAPAPLPAPSTSGGLIWPAGGIVTSPYGPRWGRMHSGIDIAAQAGSSVVAAQGGTVVTAESYGGYGNMVVIDHGSGFTTLYAHLGQISVTAGQTVGQGTQVGLMGCSGSCTGPHVHFETRVNGSAQDPRSYI